MRIIVYLTFMLSLLSYAQTNDVIDSLENVIYSNTHDTIKTFAFSDLCWEYRQINQQKSIEYGLKGINLARQINYRIGEGKTLNDLSIIYIDLGKLDSAIILLNEAKKIRDDLHDDIGVAAIHNKLGIIYQNQNELEKALQENLFALKIYEENQMPEYITHVNNNIANIHFRLGDYDKAIEIHNKTLKLREDNNNVTGMAQTYVNLANIYDEIAKTKLAIDNYKKAIKIFESEDDEKSLSFALNNLGSAYIDEKEYKNAKINLERALKIRQKIGDQKTICSTEIILGKLYYLQPNPNYKKAEIILKNALKLNKNIGLKINEKDIYYELANVYKLTLNTDSAFYYQDLYNQILKDEYQQKLNSKVSELQTVYETEKKDKENERLARINAEEEAKRKSVELKLANRNKWIFGIGLSALSILLLSIVIVQRNKFIAKQELQLKIDEEKLKGLKAIFETQEKERDRISKDLHDGIGQQLSGLKMAWDKLSTHLYKSNSAQFEELMSLTKILDDTAIEVRNISHQMMPKALIELGLEDALRDMFDKSFRKTDIETNFEVFGINEQRFDSQIEKGLYRIAQELVNNIIKHANATHVDFQLFKIKNTLQMIVADNGNGFSPENSNGHGMSNIKTRLTTINGKIDFEFEKGTTVRIIISLS